MLGAGDTWRASGGNAALAREEWWAFCASGGKGRPLAREWWQTLRTGAYRVRFATTRPWDSEQRGGRRSAARAFDCRSAIIARMRTRDRESERLAGELLRQARAEKHLSQRGLATMAGVPQSTVARIEGGHMQPSLPLLYRILEAAGLKPRTVLEPLTDVSIGTSEALPAPPAYRPMTLVDLAGHLTSADDDQLRWRLIAEFLEEHRHEPIDVRAALVRDEPPATGDERWDVFLAALAEHLAGLDDRGTAAWAAKRRLEVFWFPFNSAAARVDAFAHAPAAFRRRGIFVAPQELTVA